ncbi:hypothetical protein ACYJ2U_001753 [Clostridium botulinum]
MNMNNEVDLTDIWGDPRTYKGIKIYPILMKDIAEFYNKSYPLTIDKEGISMAFNNPEILTMSYFDFYTILICMAINEDGDKLFPTGLEDLFRLLQLVFREQQFSIATNLQTGKPMILIEIGRNKTVTIRGSEFDKLKEIILKQNNAYMEKPKNLHPEVQKAIEKAIEYHNKRNKEKMATLEEQIASYGAATCKSYDEIKKMTKYQFDFGISRLSLLMSCRMIWAMSASGMIPAEDIPNWLQHIPKTNGYEDILVSSKELDKFEGVT